MAVLMDGCCMHHASARLAKSVVPIVQEGSVQT